MKKLFFVVAFLAVSMFASAQFYIGGNVGFNKTDIEDVTTYGFEFDNTLQFGLYYSF